MYDNCLELLKLTILTKRSADFLSKFANVKNLLCFRLQHCVPPLVSTLTMCTKLQLVQWPSPSFLVVSCNRNLEIAPDVALEAHLFLISPFLRVRFPYVL